MKAYKSSSIAIVLGITMAFCSSCEHNTPPPPTRTILAGTDYLKTLPNNPNDPPDSSFDLPLPGGAPVTVVFVGNPTSGHGYDTAITRLDDVKIQPGGSGMTRLQMTELSLKSEKPVTIQGQQYNLSVQLDPGKPSMGSMTLNEDKNAPGSGTFRSSFDEIHFVVSFDPVGSAQKLPDLQLSSSLIGNTEQEFHCCQWVSNPKQANPPCTVVSPKPKGAHDTNQHTGKNPDDLDIFPNGKINENHNHTSRWHKAACI